METADRVTARRRACLVVPAASARMLASARRASVDEVVLDLEDAVVPSAKSSARSAASEAIRSGGFACNGLAVRVNAPGTPWGHKDVIVIGGAATRPRSIVVPKVEGAGDLAFIDRLLDGVEAAVGHTEPLAVQALVESPAGLRALDEIAAASMRLEAIVLGYADLAASLGRARDAAANLDLWLGVQDRVLAAARAAGVQAIDGPHLAIGDETGLEAAARRAADLGFDGKWAIHPSQLNALTTAFTPSAREVDRARAIVAALDRAAGDGLGTIALDGEMIDEALRVGALRILARAAR